MKSTRLTLFVLFVVVLALAVSSAQSQPNTASTAATVPALVKFSGVAQDASGKVLNGRLGVTFALYKEPQGGAALWLETQNVPADATGHYSVMLGASRSEGLPLELFTSGEARWLGVSVNGEPEQPRVLLLSVPYALKAKDAETVGGLPPSAFVLAAPPTATAGTSSANASGSNLAPALPTVTGSGTPNSFAIWTGTTSIGNSALFQRGSGATAKIGINTTTPAATLDVHGGTTLRGLLFLPATGTATATRGFNSNALEMTASAFNSTVGTATTQNFRWQAEPLNNNASTASGTLDLLYNAGANAPAETGLKIGSNGHISFASGQTFPGTVTSVALSAPASDFTVTGSPVTSAGTLKLAFKVAPTSANTPNAIVKRDSSGNFTAGAIVGKLGVEGETALNCAGCAGVSGVNSGGGIGVQGLTSGDAAAVLGQNSSTSGAIADGVDGVTGSAGSSGVAGINNGGGIGVFGTGGTGVFGTSSTCTLGGCFAGDFSGFAGSANVLGGNGIRATGGNGSGGGIGVLGDGGAGPNGDGIGGRFFGGNSSSGGDGLQVFPGSGIAAGFGGDVDINGTIYTGAKDFKIDHPLDPANKYLYHASVESSEMMNIYTGNVTTNPQGLATVRLPEWFEVVNTDFRYQLTVIGQFAQAIVASKIADHHFTIRTDKPNVEVSWQVTGVRQDPFAKAHPLVVEKDKEERLRGFYIHPDLYGAPEEKQIEWARHPQMMQQMKEARVRQLAARRTQLGP